MKRTFKRFLVIAVTALIAFSFAACEGPAGPAGPGGDSFYAGDIPRIQDGYWWIGNTQTPHRAYVWPEINPATGTWWVGPFDNPANNTHVVARGDVGETGDDGLTPRIEDGYWWVGETPLGERAVPQQVTIGPNGNWFIGGVDQQIRATVVHVTGLTIYGMGALNEVAPEIEPVQPGRIYNLHLVAGFTYYLSANTVPNNAWIQSLLWHTDDPTIATVQRVNRDPEDRTVLAVTGPDSAVRVRAIANGTATLFVDAMGAGGNQVMTQINVTVGDPVALPVINIQQIGSTPAGIQLTWTPPPGAGIGSGIYFQVKYCADGDFDYANYSIFDTYNVTLGITTGHIYTIWVRSFTGDLQDEYDASEWVSAIVAPYPFTEAVDIIVVGTGAAGAAAVIGALSVGFENVLSPAPNNAGWMANPAYWNDLRVMVLEKRTITGGLTNTAGGGNANPGNTTQVIADQDPTFEAWRTRYSGIIRSRQGINMAQDWTTGITAVYTNPNHVDYMPIAEGYPNWSKSWAVFRQMRNINTWMTRRGSTAGFGSLATTNALWARIRNIADVRLTQKATALVTTEGVGVGGTTAEVIGVEVRETTGTAARVEPTGAPRQIAARKVILATGGFSNMPFELQRYHGLSNVEFAPWVDVQSEGSGILIAREIGAALHEGYGAMTNMGSSAATLLRGFQVTPAPATELPAGNWGAFFVHGTGIFDYSTPIMRDQQIIVNSQGRRFRAEQNRGAVAFGVDAINNQGETWMIFSDAHNAATINPAVGPAGARSRAVVLQTVYTALQALPANDPRIGEIVRGETLAELAAALDMPYLVDEIVTLDAAIAGGAGTWADPLTLSTHPNYVTGRAGKTFAQSNIRWLDADDPDGDTTGPFWALRWRPVVWDSTGGVATDFWGRVLRETLPDTGSGLAGLNVPFDANHIVPADSADIILNLYAAGSASNRWYYGYQYQSMTSLGVGPAHAALAGRHAARSILGVPHTIPVALPGVTLPAEHFADN